MSRYGAEVEAAWDALVRDLRLSLPGGVRAVVDEHRERIEAAILGEPDPREFRELTFDEQRASMARYRRQWAADAKGGRDG
jgi:hypothetical protein